MPKWIIVSGGVLSGLGKGIVSASIGRILSQNYKVVPVKCDGYLNVDPGTMNPIEHGEVFVLSDGGEVDMDFGHYERFMNINCNFNWNLTSGKIFRSVINKERRGEYLGQTVQIVPHVINEIKLQLKNVSEKENADIMLVEIGGTIGDIENMIFYEAVRQLKLDYGRQNTMYIHLTYVPELKSVGEQKTKPTQQSTDLLQQAGIQPDIIIGRSEKILSKKSKKKIALFCNLEVNEVFSNPNINNVYELPLIFEKEGLTKIISKKLNLKLKPLSKWSKIVNKMNSPEHTVNIAICGKYTKLQDSYVSIIEALTHAGAWLAAKVNIDWVETTNIEKNPELLKKIKKYDGVIVPGGFGTRGAEGKVQVIEMLRQNNIPFLGLCYGLQLAVVEYARNVCGLEKANSTEVDSDTPHPVVFIMPEQKNKTQKGASMRLGDHLALINKKSKVANMYKATKVYERHRHRYEVNPLYHQILQSKGLKFSGMCPDKELVEYIELPEHKFFIATQSHPELKSRLERPSPLFTGFLRACISN